MQMTGSEQMGYTGTKDRTDCYQRRPKKDVPLMESAKIKGGDSSPPVIYMLNEGCNPVLTTGSPEATGYISVSHVSEEAVEEEEEGKEEEEDLMLFFVMDQEQIRNSLCDPVVGARLEQPERGHGDPENRMGGSEGKSTLTIQDNNSEDLTLNCHQEELVSADSQSAHRPSFFDSTTLAHTPRVRTGQERTQVFKAGLGEDTLRTNIFLAQEQSTYECHQVSQDISKDHQDAEPSKRRSDEDLPLQLETSHEKEKGHLVVIEAQEEMSSKIEGTGRMESSPLSTDEKNDGELREEREDVKLAFRQPSSEFPEDSRIKAGGTQTTPNGISLLLSSKEVNNKSDMGVKVEDLGQNVFIYSDLQLLEEEDAEEGTAQSLMETKPAKRHRDGGEVERLSRTKESGPADMETGGLEDTTPHGEEDLDWKEMEDEMKMEQEKLLLGNNDQEGEEQDMQTQKTSKEEAGKETAAPPLMLGLATPDYHLEKDPTLPDVKENRHLVEADGIPLKEPFASDSSLESSVAEQMASARLPAEGLTPVSISPRAHSPTCYGQWEYSGIYGQSGCVSCSGQDCEQHTEGGGSVEDERSENDGDGQCVRSVDGEGKTPFSRDLPSTPEPQNLNDFQGMDLPVEGEINISATPMASPLQNDAGKGDGPGDCFVLHEEPDSIQELPKLNLPLPCQPDKAVSGDASALGRDETVQPVHKNSISSKGSQEDAQDSASEILHRALSGAGLSNAGEESINPSLVGQDETWDPELTQAQDQSIHHKSKKHLEPHVRNFGFPGKEAEEDISCAAQETAISDPCFLGPNRVGSNHNTDTDTPPDRCISDQTQLTNTLPPGSDSDQALPPELASSHFCQPSSPTLDGRHSVPFLTSPSNGDFLAQTPDPTMDPTQPSQILEQLPPSSQTCQFFHLEPVPTQTPQSAAPNELLDQPPASDFHQDCQLPDHLCNSQQSPSLEYDDHQPAPIPVPPKKHKHFAFPALNTKQDHQNFPSSPLPVFTFTTDPHNLPPSFHSHKRPSPDGERSEETESSLPVRCMEANGHVRSSVHMADSVSQAIPPSDGSQNFKLVSNTDGGVEKLPLVQLAKFQETNAPQDQKGNIGEAPSDLEVSLLGARSDLIILNDVSVVNPTYGVLKAGVTDTPDGTSTSNRISVESQKTPKAAEVQDSVWHPPLLAFTNPMHFLQLGPPSPPTMRHPSRQQAIVHGPHWRQQQQQIHNVKIDAGLTPVMMPGVTEDAGKFRKGLEKPMVETIPAAVPRKEELAKHPPLEKSTSCPNKNAIRPDTKEPESNSRKQEVLLKLRAKSKDWHRQGLRKVSIPTDSALAEAIASLVPSKEEVPAHREREHSDHVTSGEKKPSETFDAFIKRRCSKLIHSSELLYQKYSDDALNKAIQSQKRAGSVPEDLELGSPNSPRLRRKALHSQDSYLHRLSVSSSTSLWQDIPMVRGSTMLLSMTHEEQKLQEAKFELIASEASYLRSLNVAVDHFQCSQELQAVLNNQEKQWLFSRLPDVRDVSANFLFDLEEKLEENMFNFNVCDVALRHAPEFRRVYLPYVTNQTYQQQTFRRLLNDVPAFQLVLEKLESDPICQRLSLKSFLILPFQRITRLKLLLQNILKRTPPGAEEELQATQAYDALEKLIKDCNENVQRMKNTEELIYLSQNMEFECKIFPLISQSRRLIKRGELLALEYNISLKWKLTTRPIYLHLFNDYLLLSRPRENGRFIVFDYAASSDVRGEKCEMKLHGANKNVFRLFLLQNSQGKKVEFLFRTETQSEKLRWISALAPQQAEPDLLDDSDAPQVQCVKPYKARENDELALEKADIIMVLQQSTDGWSEGVKLSDGERGWFPSEQVEPIASKEARRINLKEQLRVKNAKQHVFRRK